MNKLNTLNQSILNFSNDETVESLKKHILDELNLFFNKNKEEEKTIKKSLTETESV